VKHFFDRRPEFRVLGGVAYPAKTPKAITR